MFPLTIIKNFNKEATYDIEINKLVILLFFHKLFFNDF